MRRGEPARLFGPQGRNEAEAALADLDRQRCQHPDGGRSDPLTDTEALDLTGRTWVTRAGAHFDRITWLIRRFIDAEAELKFVTGRR